MTQGKRSGGPKTVGGKSRSSKNAISHGLTSMVPSSSNEQTLVDSYSKELIEYYKPESPLEQLQIKRIAICRAKLAHLYELEQVKLLLAAKELESQPEKILEKIPGATGLAMGMAKEFITSGQIHLPCRLSLPLLEAICKEIYQMHGVMENKNQFARALPILTKYLNSYPVVGLDNTSQWMEKLSAISKDIKTTDEMGDKHTGKFEEVIKGYLRSREYEALLEKEAMRPGIEELEKYQEALRIRRGQPPKKVEPLPKVDPDAISDMKAVKECLGRFLTLQKSYERAQKLVVQYQEIKDLMLRALSLQVAESDLLMRYQTTLERRLSSAIGELLALQRSSKS
ncbi:hypothetical protein [Polynucleobacter sp.]|uniref:hypothetical protein n=1 Tax=Polynucleobacter sp. TaxID=2029855 RepID=UPI003F69CAEE